MKDKQVKKIKRRVFFRRVKRKLKTLYRKMVGLPIYKQKYEHFKLNQKGELTDQKKKKY